MRLIAFLNRYLEETLLCLALLVITLVMLAQIVARYIFLSPMIWPEELCRLCWIWSVLLSLPYTLKHGTMLRISTLADALPQSIRKILAFFSDMLLVLLMGLFFLGAFRLFGNYLSSGSTTPAMALPYFAVYGVASLLGFALALLRSVQRLLSDSAQLFSVKACNTVKTEHGGNVGA